MTDKIKIENYGLTFNQSFRFSIFVPYNKSVCPVLEFFLYHFPLGKKKLFGSGTFSLRDPLAWFFGEEDDDDYIRRWRDFFAVATGGHNDEPKPKVEKLKAPRVKAENRLLYMDDLIYELPSTFKSKNSQRKEAFEEKLQEEEIKRNGVRKTSSILSKFISPLNFFSSSDAKTALEQPMRQKQQTYKNLAIILQTLTVERGSRMLPRVRLLDELLEERDKEELTEEELTEEEMFRIGLVNDGQGGEDYDEEEVEDGQVGQEGKELEVVPEERPEEQEGSKRENDKPSQSVRNQRVTRDIMERSYFKEQSYLSQSGYGRRADASLNFEDL